MGIFSGQQTAEQINRTQVMKKAFLIICVFFFVLGIRFLSEAEDNREKRIMDLLSQTEKVEDLEYMIHSNRHFLEAISLILLEAEEKNMGSDELRVYYLDLLARANWKKWTPYLRTTKVVKNIYVVSIGAAAVTQPSSLYLFFDSHRLLIDRRDEGGTIAIFDASVSDHMQRIKVTYQPVPGSTRPMKATAYLEKKKDKWKVIKVVTKEDN
ncbi:MAG TPA: hypothetical protein DD713_03970 [Nitrospiraceae bacterium]|nr:hypothetical protein [Nitrospiraceae bacterium]